MVAPFVISMKLIGDATSGVAAVDQQRVSLEKLSATALGVQGNTANIAAQFQDIFVTAGMGMSPLQIALQQGTQLSAALGDRGLKGTVGALSAAFGSLLSPVSLATVAIVGLGAFGLQAIGSMLSSTEDATDALEEHSEWLEAVLYGYEQAGKAAERAAARARTIPGGVVVSDLQRDLRVQAQEVEKLAADIASHVADLQARIAEASGPAGPMMTGLNREDIDSFVRQLDLLRELGISAESTVPQLNAAMEAARELYNTTEDPALAEAANEAYTLARALLQIESQAYASRAALAELNNRAVLDDVTAAAEQAADAIGAIVRLRPELRTAQEQATDELNRALATGDAVMRSAALKEYAETMAALDEQERRRNEERSSRVGGKSVDQWGSTTANLQQQIEMTRLEIDLLGQSTFESERQRTALELLNQAKQAGIPITDEVLAQIGQMSAEYASAQAELEQTTEAQRRLNEELDFYKGTFSSFFGDLKSGLRDGLSMWDAFASAGANALDSIADRALGMAADGIFDLIFGSIMGGLTGGFGSLGNGIGSGATWGGLQNFLASANGNVFQSAGLSAYSNSIVERPTVFPFARGIGLMGEAGPEAIMPLKRTSSGALGVQVADGGGRSGGGVVFQLIDQRRSGSVQREETSGPNGEKIIRAIIRDEVRQASRRGVVGF